MATSDSYSEGHGDLKLYSKWSILLATFLGSPAAGALLMRRNLVNLGRKSNGTTTAAIGIVSSIVLFGILAMFQNKIPYAIAGFVVPTVYMAIVAMWVGWSMGAELDNHKKEGGTFYSAWRAVGIGIVALVIITSTLSIVGGFSALLTIRKYRELADDFARNEKTLTYQLQLMVDAEPEAEAAFLAKTAIPLIEQSLEIVDQMDSLGRLNETALARNRSLRDYCQIQLRLFELRRKECLGEIESVDPALQKAHRELEEWYKRHGLNAH